MFLRFERLGSLCAVLFVLTSTACEVSTALPREDIDGLWKGDFVTHQVCFYVSPDESQLIPQAGCNLEASGDGPYAFEMRGGDSAGTDENGDDCGFGFGYKEPVPIADKSFAVEGYSPPGTAEEISFSGAFSGDTASGTTSKVAAQSRCEIEWTATRIENGSGGTGGVGGGGGTGGTGGEDPITGLENLPDCNAGEPLDFADGTFGSGWSESLTETSPPESSYAARQATSGGNPGRYRSIDLSNGTSTSALSTCVMSVKEDATYDPAEGAVSSLYLSFQAATPGSEHSSLETTFSVLIIQGEEMFWSGADSPRVRFADGWVDHQMTEAELRLFPSSSTMQAPDPTGEPLQFGFMTCVNGTREDSAADNWIVRLCH